MGDVRLLVKRLGLGVRSQQVEGKAFEYLRLATARLGSNALGKAEVAKAALCVDLACVTLQVHVDAKALVNGSGVSSTVYKNARAMLQKTLGVRSNATPRDICLQFGCTRIELPLRAAFASFKQKLSETLSPADRAAVNLSDPVYLAAVFLLVARKHRVKVPRDRLLSSLGLTSLLMNRTLQVVTDAMPELSKPDPPPSGGTKGRTEERKKRKRTEKEGDAPEEKDREEEESGVEAGPGPSEQDSQNTEEASSEQEHPLTADEWSKHEEGQYESEKKVSSPSEHRKRKTSKKQHVAKNGMTEKILRQAVLDFAAHGGAPGAGAAEGPCTRSGRAAAAKTVYTQTRTGRGVAGTF